MQEIRSPRPSIIRVFAALRRRQAGLVVVAVLVVVLFESIPNHKLLVPPIFSIPTSATQLHYKEPSEDHKKMFVVTKVRCNGASLKGISINRISHWVDYNEVFVLTMVRRNEV